MTTSGEVSMDVFKALVSRAGMELTDAELAELKEAYDVFQPGVDNLTTHSLEQRTWRSRLSLSGTRKCEAE